MQDSAGAVIGALLGSWLLQYDFRLVCSAGAALFIACAAFNAWYLPAWKLSTVKTPIREGLGRVLRDKRFVTCVLTLTGYYMLAVQVMLMLPIMVNDIAGSPAAVKWMYAIEATISLTLLYPIARWSEKRFRLEHRLMAGLLVMTLAMLPIGMTSSLQQLFILICLFYIGSIICRNPPARRWALRWRTPGRVAAIWVSAVWGSPSAARWVTRAAAGCLMPGKPSASPNCRG